MTHLKPIVVLAIGDPAGIGPELAAKMVGDDAVRSAANLIVIGDRRVLAAGAKVAGTVLDVETVGLDIPLPKQQGTRPQVVDIANLDPSTIEVGQISRSGASATLENFKTALALGASGYADAVAFTPFNKSAMRLAHPGYEDEIVYSAEVLQFEGRAREFNIIDALWNARVTSHVPLREVAHHINEEAVLEALKLTNAAMTASGFVRPRIGVAGLNPHAGDGGNFGREEIELIRPAVERAQALGIACDGPFPSDTVFLRARRGQFDGVLTMYHDQGQIAMKLIGFEQGVTLLGGFPFPICTPAHGTAFDIAGRGVADSGAARAAVLLAAKMGRARMMGAKASTKMAGASIRELRRTIAA
jgi:4-hydroxythreonine-4-phosphate dehydrogenase